MAEEYTDYEGMRQNSHKVLKTVLKIVLIALILFILGAIIIRSCMRRTEKHILYSDALKTALEENGEVDVYYQTPHDSINRTKDGTFQFSISDVYYIQTTHQLQVTVRFNTAVLKDVKEKYALSEIPDENCFCYSLLLKENEDSDLGGRITSYSYSADERGNYRFIYLLFDGVDLDEYTAVTYTPEDAAVTDAKGNIIAHETEENGKYILYETDENGAAKVYKYTFVSLETYYVYDADYSNGNAPLSSLLVFNRRYALDKVSDYKKYIDYAGKYKIIKVN